MENIEPDKSLKLLIVEASDRILPGLPPRLSNAAAERLTELGVEMHTRERIVEVREDGMVTADGKFIPASMLVWSAGIKAPDFLKDIAGLETNRIKIGFKNIQTRSCYADQDWLIRADNRNAR